MKGKIFEGAVVIERLDEFVKLFSDKAVKIRDYGEIYKFVVVYDTWEQMKIGEAGR